MLTPESLARTYSPKSYADAADLLNDYDRVKEYASRNSDHGRTRVGKALDLPPSRVRSWLNDGKPNSVRAVETARNNGWIDFQPDSRVGDAFGVLTAATYACGGISAETHVPAWNPDHNAVAIFVRHALDVLGVGSTTRHAADAERPTEIVAASDASVLGRSLEALGLSLDTSHVPRLPNWLFDCANGTRRTCGLVWALERTTEHDHSEVLLLQLRNRSRQFREGVALLLRILTDGPIRVNDTTVSIPPEARTRIPLYP